MHKSLIIAKREYKAAVKTKAFIIGLLLAPILMGGSFIAMVVFQGQVDTRDKVVKIIDRSGFIADDILRAAAERNQKEVHSERTGQKVRPAYIFEVVEPAGEELLLLRAELSEEIRQKSLHAFVEIPEEVLHPGEDAEPVSYHAENAALDDLRQWLGNPINNAVREERLREAGIRPEAVPDLFKYISVEGMGLLSRDAETGDVTEASRSSELRAIAVPMFITFLMFMMVMMGATPLLQSVMEEKNQRVAEVVLGSATPFQFMLGKVLGGLGVSLTAASVYVGAGVFTVLQTGGISQAPLHLIPWFFLFLLLAITMMGAIMAAVGSACNDAKDAQNLAFPAMLPIMIPLFVMFPILREPMSSFATWISFIPPFTPTLMLLRMSTPGGIPAWQPWVGLLGVALFAGLTVWLGGRIFRIGILMQGQPPRIGQLVRWAIRG